VSAESWTVIGSALAILFAVGATSRETNRRIDALSRRIDDLAERVSRLEGRFEEMSRWSKDIVEALVRRPAA
jgi:hypothetical protein